jgi:hypothetical protein
MRIRAAALSVVVVASGALVTSLVVEQPPAAAPSGNPSAVIAWNDIAQRSAIQVAKQYQTQSMIYISFVQAAVYDAAVAIAGRYQPYMLELAPRRGASLDAAVATAAHGVLVHFFPEQQAALDADYTRAMAAVPEGTGRDAGVDVGREAAAGIILNREGDGLEADIGFVVPPSGPGVWQLPSDQTPQTPWVSELRPFLLRRPDQFRPGPPPDLDTSAWVAGFNEVQRHGGSNSRHRTADETDVARFWSTNAIAQYNASLVDDVYRDEQSEKPDRILR